MFEVRDYYENPFGEAVYVTDDIEDAYDFCGQYEYDTDGECDLIIKCTVTGMKIEPKALEIL